MTDRTMYDSTNMAAIPADAQIVAGYPHAFPTDYAAFPHALQVKIDQHGNHADDCHEADVENGAISLATIRQWVQSWHVLHPNGLAAVNGWFDVPTVYIQESNLQALRSQLVGLLYDIHVAWWDRGTGAVAGTSLLQYASPSSNPPSGGDYDVSVVYDTSWGVKTPPSWQATALALAKKTETDATAVVTYLEAHQ
jgi:hypothetical protein